MLKKIPTPETVINLVDKAKEILLSISPQQNLFDNCDSFLKKIIGENIFESAVVWIRKEHAEGVPFHSWEQLYKSDKEEKMVSLYQFLFPFENLSFGKWMITSNEENPEYSHLICAIGEKIRIVFTFLSEYTPDIQAEVKAFVEVLLFWGKILAQKIYDYRQGEELEELLLMRNMYEQAREEAQEKEKLFTLVSEHTQDLIILHESNGAVAYASPSVEALLGYEVRDLFTKQLRDLIHPEDFAGLKDLFDKARKNKGKLDNLEYRAIHRDGRAVWVESSIKLIYHENEKLARFQTVTRDINARKEAERRLMEEKNKAEKANQAKSEFLSTISHEIRTPMNAVIGLSHLLMEDNPRPDQLNTLRTLHFSAENLLFLINDILDYSKIEAGKITFENKEYNLYELVDGIHRTFQPKTGDKNISFQLEWDRRIPKRIIGDQVRLAQILNNLIGNAIKFTEKGEIKLKIDLLKQTEANVDLRFAVEDTGIGIPLGKQKEIFNRFSQAADNTTRKFGGTGLGLAITKNLLELQGSEIQLESEVGKGSCFFFNINFKLAKDQQNSQKKDLKKRIEAGELEGLRVLVAEDNSVNRMIVERFLKKWGIDARFAVDGQEALDLVKAERFDLVLMDIHMPIKDGLEASMEIRHHLGLDNHSLPIVALTASTMTEDKEKAAAAGMDGYIGKPFDPYELFQKIYRYGKEKRLGGLIYK